MELHHWVSVALATCCLGATPVQPSVLACSLFTTDLLSCLQGWAEEALNAIVGLVFVGNVSTTFAPIGNYALSRPPEADVRYYMHYAGAAYCFSSLASWTCPWCVQSPGCVKVRSVFNNSDDTVKAFIVVDSCRQEIVLSLRGSHNAPNLVNDATAILVDAKAPNAPGARVHLGFNKETKTILNQSTTLLEAALAQNPTFTVVITGHSLGGSMASLLLFRFKQLTTGYLSTANFKLFTYGAPRTGNKVLANYMNGLSMPIARVVNRGDIAPQIAPAVLGFYHHQNEFWIYNVSGNGTGKYCSIAAYEDPNCSDSAFPTAHAAVDHLRYFDVDVLQCGVEIEPLELLLALLAPVSKYIPKDVLEALQGVQAILQELSPTPLLTAVLKLVTRILQAL